MSSELYVPLNEYVGGVRPGMQEEAIETVNADSGMGRMSAF